MVTTTLLTVKEFCLLGYNAVLKIGYVLEEHDVSVFNTEE
jgi:hypothetical protein